LLQRALHAPGIIHRVRLALALAARDANGSELRCVAARRVARCALAPGRSVASRRICSAQPQRRTSEKSASAPLVEMRRRLLGVWSSAPPAPSGEPLLAAGLAMAGAAALRAHKHLAKAAGQAD
jgi:hypothetical protein